MRFRMLFGLPALMCFALVSAVFASPPRLADHWPGPIYEVSHVLAMPDLTADMPAHVAIVVKEQRHDALSPKRDGFALAYLIGNQPHAAWRAATLGYQRIDPHIRAG